jgi:hypothetical protein
LPRFAAWSNRETGVANPVHLIASHCRPWRDSTNPSASTARTASS